MFACTAAACLAISPCYAAHSEKAETTTKASEASATAEKHMVNGELAAMEELLTLNGISFKRLEENDSEQPILIAELSGHYCLIVLAPADSEHKMASLLLSIPDKKITLAQINEWNTSRFYGRAYLDKDNAPFVSMELLLSAGGISEELFEQYLGLWEEIVKDFDAYPTAQPATDRKSK